jgi:HK97 family phage prohead protease
MGNQTNPPKMEKRAMNSRLEIRENDGGGATIAGVAVPYGKPSEEMWGFREIIAPGAFAASLSGGLDIRCLWSHDTGKPLGRTSNNTLRLRDAPEGLSFECDLGATSWSADAREAIKRGDVAGMSFGFIVRKDDWAFAEDATVRTVIEAELFEVSPVAFPAYPDSSVEARSALLEEGLKRALANKPIPLAIYQKRLKLLEKTGGM